MDLVNTIGESVALGASGAVLWGASADYNDKVIKVIHFSFSFIQFCILNTTEWNLTVWAVFTILSQISFKFLSATTSF